MSERMGRRTEHRTTGVGADWGEAEHASAPLPWGRNGRDAVGAAPSRIGALDEFYAGDDVPEMPSDEEVDRLIRELEGRFDGEQVADLLATCRDTVVQSIVGPFGLGRVLAEYDKRGGSVLTLHNAKAYREGDKEIHVPDSAKYDQKDYKHDKGVRARKLEENSLPDGLVKDDYTGKSRPPGKVHVDHVKPKEEFHYDEGGYVLSKEARKDFANDMENLAVTDQGINKSKGSKPMSEAKERNPEMDGRRTGPREKRGEEVAARHRPSATEQARYYPREVAPEAVTTGVRLGMREAVGLCLHELTIGVFHEVADICRNGLRDDEKSYSEAVWKRVLAVLRSVQAKWHEMLAAFKEVRGRRPVGSDNAAG